MCGRSISIGRWVGCCFHQGRQDQTLPDVRLAAFEPSDGPVGFQEVPFVADDRGCESLFDGHDAAMRSFLGQDDVGEFIADCQAVLGLADSGSAARSYFTCAADPAMGEKGGYEARCWPAMSCALIVPTQSPPAGGGA